MARLKLGGKKSRRISKNIAHVKTFTKPPKWQAQYKKIAPYVTFKKPKKVTPYFKAKVKKYYKLVHYYKSKPHIEYRAKSRSKAELQKLNKVKKFSNQNAKELKAVFVHNSGIKRMQVKFDKRGNVFLDSPQVKITKINFSLIEYVKADNKKEFIAQKIKASKTKAKRFSLQVGIFENNSIYTAENIPDAIEALQKGSPLDESEKDAFQGLLGHEYKGKLKTSEAAMRYRNTKKSAWVEYENDLDQKPKKRKRKKRKK
jgi:DNA mismatch repair ATPase MutS